MIIAILGRQPKIGLAELESLCSSDAVEPLGPFAAGLHAQVNPEHLGSAIKIARPIAELPFTDWQKIVNYCTTNLTAHLAHLPEGKLKIGLSSYGLPIEANALFRAGLEIKKACRALKRSVRIVPGDGTALNSASVLHNQLTGPLGLELLFIKNGSKTWLAQTTWVQDVDAYARRDFDRPRRDAFVGMLPPKLAQTMLNFAHAHGGERVLDPFCGTGVVLQEAALRGCDVYGTDLNPRMVEYTQDNLRWLQDTYMQDTTRSFNTATEVADATNASWQPRIDHIVCETYLGQPLSGLPKPEKLSQIISDCDTIISKFLKNAHPQLAIGTTLCIAVPAWRTHNTFKRLPLLDRLEDLGYNRTRFKYASWDDLIYHRHDQIVARELLVLTVK